MELRDYVRMLKRGWPTVVLLTALVVGLASLYLVLTPKRYEAGTTLFVSASDPQSITDLQQGATFGCGNAAHELLESLWCHVRPEAAQRLDHQATGASRGGHLAWRGPLQHDLHRPGLDGAAGAVGSRKSPRLA